MSLPFKPHIIALLCSAGLLAAAGTLYVQSRTPETVTEAAAQPAPAPTPTSPPAAAQPVTTTYTQAQIDQWVAPIALYPDSLLSQVLMASTYPDNVMQAVQWSQDNPAMKGDAAVQAVASQPWDPSVKSLVAFPALLAMMGENPPWVENLGNAFLAQPHDVMDSVQRLRTIAQQTGTLKSTPQQKVIVTAAAPAPTTTAKSNTVSTSTTTAAAPAPTQVIKIEPTDPQVVYVPNYNPASVYGTWPNSAYPPVYLPPPPGEQFTDSFVKGFGYSLGVATTWALFSSIDWDDDDDHHHHDDDYHHGDYSHNGDNININVNNFNHITGENLPGNHVNWQHNPAYRGHTPYPDNTVAQRFHQTNVSGGMSATQHAPVDREAQRQAAMTQLQHNVPAATAGNLAANNASRDAQRQAASAQLKQATQRSNYRGYDSTPTSTQQQRREAAKTQLKNPTPQQQQRRETVKSREQNLTPQQQQHRQQIQSATPAQRQQQVSHLRASALSGNESRAPSWQAQQERGLQSRQFSAVNREERGGARERLSEHHELRRR
ncbi:MULTISPECIES: DUF3300 domain-containing protein [Klebsiella]|nr:DUF3300 domain-containing protein [Klebsiella variicola]HCB0184872.1 DUF3300 domain-containing protein [Klebsiella variicola subsp. variicola]EIV7249953.1 DUF3300 domain-containing protein [Klebsiella variicola]EIY5006304.1 DUF3300 domain-containing protein [Klebsiella variicola]EKV8769246.1 DUF3300 domain-containing protein [Klebsiella variicola]EKW0518019.1 DUF3300 domain-containing protein [Klebsiella variicola]